MSEGNDLVSSLLVAAEGEGIDKGDLTAVMVSAYESQLLQQEDELKKTW